MRGSVVAASWQIWVCEAPSWGVANPVGALSRRKGHAFENEVCGWLRALPGVTAKRVLVEVREGNSGDIETSLPLSIQCKVGAMPPIYKAIQQAREAAKPGQTPVAFIRRNAARGREVENLVVLDADRYLSMLAELRLTQEVP